MTESITYVRERFLEAEKPPASEKSAYAWIRNNLFASWKDSILSIIAIAAIVYYLPTAPSASPRNRAARCRPAGAAPAGLM